jgi:acetamidase/formamidase
MSRWDFADVDAYVLCSAVMNLHFAQVVNEPLLTVTASIAKGVLPDQRLF